MATPTLPFAPFDANSPYIPEDQIAQQYNLANMLRRQPQATSFAGVLANGLGAVGGNLVQGSANNALQSNQALRSQAIQNVGSATDAPSLSKALLGSPVPEMQNLGLKTQIAQITDDPAKEYRVRAAQALKFGMQMNTPEFRDYVLTGKIKGQETELPSNIREWNIFNRMTPEQQQQYLTMKRADKYLDTGTEFVRPNPVNPSQPVASIPKNVAGKKEQEELGTATAKAKVDLPTAVNNADKIVRTIDAVVTDPYLPNMTGPISGRLPNLSGKSQDLQSKIDQIGGQTFLQAFESLRGGGQITEAEGGKATNSLNRLQNAKVGTAEWIAAAREFRQDVLDLAEIAKRKAAGNYTPLPATHLVPEGGAPLPPGWSIEKVQ